jgi:hypothetical protein
MARPGREEVGHLPASVIEFFTYVIHNLLPLALPVLPLLSHSDLCEHSASSCGQVRIWSPPQLGEASTSRPYSLQCVLTKFEELVPGLAASLNKAQGRP